MYIGTNTINGISIGSTTVNEVWIGNTQVYPTTVIVTYTLTNQAMNLSDGSLLQPSKSNYGYITATLNEYHDGTLYSSKTVTCIPHITSSLLSQYFTVSGNYIRFNYDDYKAVDLYSIFGDTYTTAWYGEYFDISTANVYIATTSNKKTTTSTTYVGLTISPTSLDASGGNVSLSPAITNQTTNSYTSGYSDSSSNHLGSISLYRDSTSIGTTTHLVPTIYSVEANTGTARTISFSARANGKTAYAYLSQSGVVSYYYIDQDLCFGCGSCLDSGCPTDAIHENSSGQYSIDPDECIACANCVNKCPINAIKPA